MSRDMNNFMITLKHVYDSFEGPDLTMVVRDNNDVAMCHRKTDGSYQERFRGTLIMSCPASWSVDDAAVAHRIAQKAYKAGVESGRRELGSDIAELLGVATEDHNHE